MLENIVWVLMATLMSLLIIETILRMANQKKAKKDYEEHKKQLMEIFDEIEKECIKDMEEGEAEEL